MGFVEFGPITFPSWPTKPGAAPNLATLVLDASGEKAAVICYAPKTGNIAKIGWPTATVTTGSTFDVRLETVSLVTGDPTGTLWNTTTNGSQVVANADDNVWLTTTLTSQAAVVQGDTIAVVLVQTTGNMSTNNFFDDFNNIAYPDHFTAAWSKQATQCGMMALEYSDGSYAHITGVHPYLAVSYTSFNSGSTPDERGLYFSFPFPVQVSGWWAWADGDEDFTVRLYDSDGSTVLLSSLADTNVRSEPTGGGICRRQFAGTVNLSANTFYRLTVLPGTATDVRLGDFDVNAAAIMDACEGGRNFHFTSRTDGGVWTQTTTKRPWMGLLVNALSDGEGGFMLNE